MISASEQFKSDIQTYWLGDGRDLQVGSDLRAYLRNPHAPLPEQEFKRLLADSILNKRFSVEEYERLTDVDCETREEVAEDLAQLWRLVFGDEPIALPGEPSGG